MSRLPPLNPNDVPQAARAIVKSTQDMLGFTANDSLIMARCPEIAHGFAAMCAAIYAPGQVDSALKRLIGYIASTAAGCKYCQSHSAHGVLSKGVDAEKLNAAWDYQNSDLFSKAERAALCVAQYGAMSPSEVTDVMFDALKDYYSDEQIIEIIAVIAMFGFLNRWNAILDTDIETLPAKSAVQLGLKLS